VLHTLSDSNEVWGVTLLDNLLYVLRRKRSPQICVYDTQSGRVQRRIRVSTLVAMADMRACTHNCCLYISGYIDKSVHRVSLRDVDVGRPVTKWPVYDEAVGLSVTDTHSLLVTCDEVRTIKEFTTHGQLLRQIELAQDVVSPWHTIQLSSGGFVVCHGSIALPGDLHRVCLIGSDGQLVKSYGGLAGSGSQRMTSPFHLAVDRNGFVFVVDLNNRRVLLLSPELTYIREVVSSDQLKWDPVRLFLDDDGRRLCVADNKWDGDRWAAGRVVVFSV